MSDFFQRISPDSPIILRTIGVAVVLLHALPLIPVIRKLPVRISIFAIAIALISPHFLERAFEYRSYGLQHVTSLGLSLGLLSLIMPSQKGALRPAAVFRKTL